MSTDPEPPRLTQPAPWTLRAGANDILPEEELTNLVRIAASLADTPVALIVLNDAGRNRVVASTGLESTAGALCDPGLFPDALHAESPVAIPDASADPRLAASPMVTGPAHVRGCAVLPLIAARGRPIGEMWVIDRIPRRFPVRLMRQLDDIARTATALLGVHRDRIALAHRLDEAEAMRDRLMRVAETDPLTGLANKAVLTRAVASRLRASPGAGTLVLIDLDHFKTVNDRYGHPFGDAYLQTVARLMTTAFGPDAVTARIGGDEFAAFLRTTDRAEIDERIDTIRSGLTAASARIGGTGLGGISVGTCSADRIAQPGFASLYQHADIALYATKRRGRNRTTHYDPDGAPPASGLHPVQCPEIAVAADGPANNPGSAASLPMSEVRRRG
ncbi:diguanylate cyclase [Rhodobacterales bacterium HKCCE3408]|nr:diguanylate cyclase [Rhodobacterales bacterium HKCCE3408]